MSGSGATVFALPTLPDDASPGGERVAIDIGIDPSLPGGDDANVLETATADHVEPVRLAD